MVKFVVVGGSFAGNAAVGAIKQTVPSADITWISASDKFFFNPASPRLVVEPDQIDKVIFNVADIAKKKGVKFLHAAVVLADLDARRLTLSDGSSVNYEYVVFATGTKSSHDAFKLADGTSAKKTKDAILDLNKRAKTAKSIVIVGGGATGVELSGELAEQYPGKKITLYTGSNAPLPLGNDKISRKASSHLEKIGVKVVNKVKVASTQESNGQTIITFQDGSVVTTDLYIPSFGNTPLTSYIDSFYLDSRGYIKTDANLRVSGATNAYALGDVVSGGLQTIVDIKFNQIGVLTSTLKHDVVDQSSAVKPLNKNPKLTILVPISRNGGVGAMFGWSVANFMVRMLKAKDFMISKAVDYAQ